MSVQSLTITTTSSPAIVAGSGSHGPIRIKLKNLGPGVAYFGGLSVTTSGYPLSTADAAIEPLLFTNEALCVCSSAGAAPLVAVFRSGDTT